MHLVRPPGGTHVNNGTQTGNVVSACNGNARESKHRWIWAAVYNHGCQAGSIRHRLSRLFAAATSVLTRLSAPSNVARSARNRTAGNGSLTVHYEWL